MFIASSTLPSALTGRAYCTLHLTHKLSEDEEVRHKDEFSPFLPSLSRSVRREGGGPEGGKEELTSKVIAFRMSGAEDRSESFYDSVKKRRLTSLLQGAAPMRHCEYVSASVIETLPHQTLCDILMDAADQHPDVASRIAIEHNTIIAAEQAKTGDFYMYKERVWKLLNADYGWNGLQIHEKASEVTSVIQDFIRDIENAALFSYNNSIRESALETLMKIGREICLSNGQTLGNEVIKHFRSSCVLETLMLRLAKSFPKLVMTKNFVRQLDELRDLSAKCCLFEGFNEARLSDVRKTLLGESDLDESKEDSSD